MWHTVAVTQCASTSTLDFMQVVLMSARLYSVVKATEYLKRATRGADWPAFKDKGELLKRREWRPALSPPNVALLILHLLQGDLPFVS